MKHSLAPHAGVIWREAGLMIVIALLLLIPCAPALAQTDSITLITRLPFLESSATPSLADLMNALYKTLIGIGALLAVIKITLAGIKYMGSEGFGGKEEAKEDIRSSLLGLIIILATVLILQTIFGGIRFDFLQGAPPMRPLNAETSITRTCGNGTQECRDQNVPCAGTAYRNAQGVIVCPLPGVMPPLVPTDPQQEYFRFVPQNLVEQSWMSDVTGRQIQNAIQDPYNRGSGVWGYHEITAAQIEQQLGPRAWADRTVMANYERNLRSACTSVKSGAGVLFLNSRIATPSSSTTFRYVCYTPGA